MRKLNYLHLNLYFSFAASFRTCVGVRNKILSINIGLGLGAVLYVADNKEYNGVASKAILIRIPCIEKSIL